MDDEQRALVALSGEQPIEEAEPGPSPIDESRRPVLWGGMDLPGMGHEDERE